jgi:hypothetical protein
MKNNILVIGLGSMGKRRIRLLLDNFKDINVYGVDNNENRRKEVVNKFNIKVFGNINQALESGNILVAIVATPPLTHYKIIKKCLLNDLHVFTEINLINKGYNELMKISSDNELELFLSSTMIYRNELEFIYKTIVESDNKVNYRYHVGQYLPDWHPWEDYNDFFVNEKESNGCRELMAIELPWIIRTFGKIEDIKVFKDKISELNINYPDTYNMILKHKSGHTGNFSVDIVSRKAIRNLEIYSEDLHIFWDGTPEGLEKYDLQNKKMNRINVYKDYEQDSNYADNIVETAYLDELKIFLNKITKNYNQVSKYDFSDDLYTLSIIDQIEE